jgi:hypothetical protein
MTEVAAKGNGFIDSADHQSISHLVLANPTFMLSIRPNILPPDVSYGSWLCKNAAALNDDRIDVFLNGI